MLVSTIITTYNHAPFIAQAIDSALMQKGVDQEIIISDDGSTDGTAEIVADYAKRFPDRIRDISSKVNLGISANMRKCIAASAGEFIAVMEGDDYWSSREKLLKQAMFLKENPDCSMVFSRVATISRTNSTPKTYAIQENLPQKIVGKDMFVNGRCGGVCLNFSTCMYRAALLKNLPEVLFESRPSEIAFSFYMETKGAVGHISTPLSIYRNSGTGVWTSADAFGHYLQRMKCRGQAKAVCTPSLIPLIDADMAKVTEEFHSYSRKIVAANRKLEKTLKEKEARLKQELSLSADLKKTVDTLKSERNSLAAKLSALNSSEAYRVGMIVTWPARKAWRLVKRMLRKQRG